MSKMFFGAQIKHDSPVIPTTQDGGQILHLSQVSLDEPTANGRTSVQIVDGDKAFTIATLQKDKIEQVTLDLFLSMGNDLKIQTKGAANVVHVVGYFEPEWDGLDDEDDEYKALESKIKGFNGAKALDNDDEEDEDEDDDDDDDDEDDDQEDLDQDDEDDDEEEDEEEEEEEEDEEEEEEEKEVAMKLKLKNAKQENKKNKGNAQPVPEKSGSVKRKADAPLKGKVEKKVTVDSNADSSKSYETELIQYINTNGPTPLSVLGYKIKKPVSITEKLGSFVKARTSQFKVENGVVTVM